MKQTLKYLLLIGTIICSLAFIINFSLEQKRITQIRNDLYGFAVDASRIPFSADWKEIIEEGKYPHLEYSKLEFSSLLKESLPEGKPFIVYRDADRIYEAYLDGHIQIHQNKP